MGKDSALTAILITIAHELTHYFQWINALHLTPIGQERQATKYARYILDDYAETREHPYGVGCYMLNILEVIINILIEIMQILFLV